MSGGFGELTPGGHIGGGIGGFANTSFVATSGYVNTGVLTTGGHLSGAGAGGLNVSGVATGGYGHVF